MSPRQAALNSSEKEGSGSVEPGALFFFTRTRGPPPSKFLNTARTDFRMFSLRASACGRSSLRPGRARGAPPSTLLHLREEARDAGLTVFGHAGDGVEVGAGLERGVEGEAVH